MRPRFATKGLLLVLIFASAISIAVIGTLYNVNASNSVASPSQTSNQVKAVLAVEGMSCGGCIATINSALSGFKGVSDVKVDLAGGKTEILYAADQISDVDAMANAITASGYPAKVIEIVAAQELSQKQKLMENLSDSTIAVVGDLEILRVDFEKELAHARSRYAKIYGDSVLSGQNGQRLLDNLKLQITRRLVAESIQLQEITRAGFEIDGDTLDQQYQLYLDKRQLSRQEFESELMENGYSTNYFMRRFRNRVLIERYVDEKVFRGVTSDSEKQQLYSEWFTNARLLAKIVYYDKSIERMMQARTGGGGCGNTCSTAQ